MDSVRSDNALLKNIRLCICRNLFKIRECVLSAETKRLQSHVGKPLEHLQWSFLCSFVRGENKSVLDLSVFIFNGWTKC